MYAYFDMDEPTLLRIRRAIIEGRINLPEDGVIPVLMGLQGEDGYPHAGTINFLNNQINSGTGSITLRGVFNNPRMFGDAPAVAAATVAFLGSPDAQAGFLRCPFSWPPVPPRNALAVAWHVCAYSPTDRHAAQRGCRDRPRDPVGSRLEVCLCGRCGQQGAISPHHYWLAPEERSARCGRCRA